MFAILLSRINGIIRDYRTYFTCRLYKIVHFHFAKFV